MNKGDIPTPAKVFIADFDKKVLKKTGSLVYHTWQPKVSYDNPLHGKLWEEYERKVEQYFNSLPEYKADWLIKSQDGKEMVEGLDFEIIDEVDKRMEGFTDWGGPLPVYPKIAVPLPTPADLVEGNKLIAEDDLINKNKL